jgi:hypothetical protein
MEDAWVAVPTRLGIRRECKAPVCATIPCKGWAYSLRCQDAWGDLCNERHLFEHIDIVRDKLLCVGFRSFADLELTSRMDGDGDEDTYMVVSGYRIGECLAWVGEGMTFDRHVWVGEYPVCERHAVSRFRISGGRVGEDISCSVSQEHRDITEFRVWCEFNSAARH